MKEVYMDNEGAIESVYINGVSLLSGSRYYKVKSHLLTL